MTAGQGFEVVATHPVLASVEHVGHQQGVIGHACQGDAVVGEDVLVVFEVLAEFGRLGIFEPGLELGQHGLARQLVGRAGVTMGERQVSGLARRQRKRNADDARREGVETGRFGVERDTRRGFDLGQPGIEARPVEQRLVAGTMGPAVVERWRFGDGDRDDGRSGLAAAGRQVGGRAVAVQIAPPAAEIERIEQGFQRFGVGRRRQ